MKVKFSIFLSKLTALPHRTLFSAIFLCLFFFISPASAQTTTPTSTATSTPALPTVAQSEARVREFFAEYPSMISIAKCESSFRQYTNNGTPLRASGRYIGVFQIDEKSHAAKAKKLGMDIYTLEGNIAYAKYLYEAAGTGPWKGCVKIVEPAPIKKTTAVEVLESTTPKVEIKTTYTLTRNLKLGDASPEVKMLQQILNTLGFTIAKTGVGSAGNETTTFGAMTRTALRRFQCEMKIVCAGTETTTGYGAVGPRTRTLLLKAIQDK